VITTFMSEEECRDAYGGGIARRLFRDGSLIRMWVQNGSTVGRGGPKNDVSGSEPPAGDQQTPKATLRVLDGGNGHE
jgi:hypothetical protein